MEKSWGWNLPQNLQKEHSPTDILILAQQAPLQTSDFQNCQIKHLHNFKPLGFLGGASVKEPACQCRRRRRHGFNLWVGKILWRRKWQPTSVFLPGKSHGEESGALRSMGSQKHWTQLSTDLHSDCLAWLQTRASRLTGCVILGNFLTTLSFGFLAVTLKINIHLPRGLKRLKYSGTCKVQFWQSVNV